MKLFIPLVILSFLLHSCISKEQSLATKEFTTWQSYLGDPSRSHFTTLNGFTKENINDLKVVWTYEAPDVGQMQMNPIVVDTLLYGVSAALRAFALDARTGKEVWRFGDSLKVWHSTSRGVSYWEEGEDKRIFYTIGSYLYALNAITGKPIQSFGQNGKIDLRSGLPDSEKDKFVISNTPGTIFKDKIIMPLRVSEDIGGALGDVLAFNVKTGEVAWVFKTIPEKGSPGNETWGNTNVRASETTGGANNWAGMALDSERELLFVPTGSASPDFYGGFRKGSNLYANSLVALDANTGEYQWHFQFTHHDLWDRDPPAPPNLLNVKQEGKTVPAVAQVTKQGYVFLFHRETGVPLFSIKEKPVPATVLMGEEAWLTQPFPIKPKPFARQANELSESDISPFAPDKDSLRNVLVNADKRIYAPPALSPVFLLPGYDGAAEWGGAGVDPKNGILYVNSNEMAWLLQMKSAAKKALKKLPLGQQTYDKYCMVCHKEDRRGIAASGYPSLIGIKNNFSKDQLGELINNGKGMMPGFPQISVKEANALVGFLFEEQDKFEITANTLDSTPQLPFKHKGYTKFLDKNGLPGISPPWGTLHAIDLNTGEYQWSVPFGETPELLAKGIYGTGCENYGGPIITENGLLFIAATKDGFFRIYDRHTGDLLREIKLPFASFATPAMYSISGKQYITLACGGEKLGTDKGNLLVTFGL
ncbi:hypothetical protein GCM10011414_03710 [Croceivirga lutea]|uniref:outer membrane protein assembly factor BamB family protein n=1 Tax=Croceivirga lutea TaxID=1775167 RepID=UPI0016397E86|nr:PQQ-binding-like beta-propeller repeat protein [Croceivirga lutea]GGG37602.1 hypothetical protein GCM10011414_03710 [Croceivirga lutea]